MDRKRILVVDDEEMWRRTIQAILSDKYDLTLAKDESEAVSYVESSPFALAILDQRMPGDAQAGVHLLERLRSIRSGLNGVILTGYADVDDAVDSIKMGILDYIDKNKPNLRQQLPVRIEKALGDDPQRERIRALMAGGEKAAVEFKASARWDTRLHNVNKDLAKAVAKTVAAFLNSEAGGVLLIGVDDDGKAIGLAHDYRTLRKQDRDGFQLFLMNLFADTYGKDVSSLLIRIEFYDIDGCDVCCVVANPAPMPVYARDSTGGEDLYVRQGNATVCPSMREAAEYIKIRWK